MAIPSIQSAILLSFLVLFLGPNLQTAKLCSCSDDHKVGNCHSIERLALLDFKKGVEDPSNRISSWRLENEDCCKWHGVGCNNVTGYVEELDLNNIKDTTQATELSGGISPALAQLKHLKYLDLSHNAFGGIPNQFIGSVKELRYLDLSWNYFEGRISQQLGNLSHLHHLDLSYSRFSIQELQFLSHLTSLEYLGLSGSDLSETGESLQYINRLHSLSELHLSFCKLSSFPLMTNFTTTLSVLDLSFNNFGGFFFKAILNFTALQSLDLSATEIQGPIPKAIEQKTSLKTLRLGLNELTGPIPDVLANFTSLECLGLHNNHLEGPIPLSFGAFCKLKELSLARNNISGEITEFVNGLSLCRPNSLLEILDLGDTKLTGNIPYSIGNLKSLRRLYLYQTSMNGTIPKSLGQLSELEALDLSLNAWDGELTEDHFANLANLIVLYISFDEKPPKPLFFNLSSNWVCPFTKLFHLDLTNCQLGPLFPSWLRNLNQLGIIKLENVGISDKIPNWFPNLSLQTLDLSNNQIRGKVPLELRNGLKSTEMRMLNLRGNLFSGTIPLNINETMPNLGILSLSNNLIEGSIPSSICNLKRLTAISLSSNNLSGELPQECWKDLQSLDVIDLSNNHLSGKLPISIWSAPQLSILSVSKNGFSGNLPPNLKTLGPFRVIDLGENSFTGNLPMWMGKRLPQLEILRLRSNSFSGFIHEHHCLLHSLQILDLAHNGLSGPIPHCFGNFSGMATVDPTDPFSVYGSIEGIDLRKSSQEFGDQVNVWITKGIELEYNGTLAFLKCIDLSHNVFSGEIPTEITRLLGLSILNLSMNQLTGRIPEKIGSMQRLEVLDLSRNQLSGSIPPSISTLNSLNHLNLSNNNLSGRIPSGNQLQTLPDPSIYAGNPGLCGAPLKDCATHPDIHVLDHDEDKEDWLPFFISMSIGFVVGFWSVCGSLLLNKSWRYAFFRFIDDMTIIPVCVVVKARSFRLGRNRNAQHA
ncbi:hypothetical protein Syun_016173 [Stephania yunnanensis]|uniref:Leucine-rich repeat-containing N-terminal plant-type domain-containing protein n=1 Tax=Stephania yunnanensis TaxID=152371 RepID=A0AAP0P4M2_9MAGN